ncbi:MAG TPA: FAD-binding protein [Rhizomicrobium sp.]|jgi:glycolate oxidase FAD binding subunit|nr:FAD-binding protein [Rhizomicrobium sp.]
MSKVTREDQVVDFVRAAREARSPFEIVAGGTRRQVGRPLFDSKGGALPMLDVSGLSGIVKYEPAELIVTAQPATPLAEIKAVLAEKGQRLGFDPADWSRLLGSNGAATLAGAASSDASGSGKLRHGGARDSLLGFRAVNGLGENFRGGAKVVKNVTGFDLPKLVCGAYGTLAVLTEMTFRVYPQPQYFVVLCLADVTPEDGFAALRKIALSALEPAGLAYLPGNMLTDVGQGAALIKLEGAAQPLEEKIALAHGLLGNAMHRTQDDPFAAIGCGEKFADIQGDIWRVMIARADAPRIAKELNARHWLGDLAGAVLWLAADPSEGPYIRQIVAKAGGQAMLLRGSAESRASLGLFAPQAPALAALGRAVKAAFDPLSLFNPGRL